jgi:hypothetical protein
VGRKRLKKFKRGKLRIAYCVCRPKGDEAEENRQKALDRCETYRNKFGRQCKVSKRHCPTGWIALEKYGGGPMVKFAACRQKQTAERAKDVTDKLLWMNAPNQRRLTEYRSLFRWIHEKADGLTPLPSSTRAALQHDYQVNLDNVRIAHSSRTGGGCITDCKKIYCSRVAFVNGVRSGSISRLLLHELVHAEQCRQWGGRNRYAVRWFRELPIGIVGGLRKGSDGYVERAHDHMPMEAHAIDKAGRLCSSKCGGGVASTGSPLRSSGTDACKEAVQGKIAWDYGGTKKWNPANVERLCRGAEGSVQPARCFRRVMHGGVDWGGGTRWQWKNALDLCRGTRDADATIACFEKRIRKGTGWREAIDACRWDRPDEADADRDPGPIPAVPRPIGGGVVQRLGEEATRPRSSGEDSESAWKMAGRSSFRIKARAEAKHCVQDVPDAFEGIEFGRKQGRNFYTHHVGSEDVGDRWGKVGMGGHMQGIARLPGGWLAQAHSKGLFLSHFPGQEGAGHGVWADGPQDGVPAFPDLPNVERKHVGGLHAYGDILVMPSDARVEIFRHRAGELALLRSFDVSEYQKGAHFASILPLEGGDWLLAVGRDSRKKRKAHRVHFYVIPSLEAQQSQLRYLGRRGRGNTREDFQSGSLIAECGGDIYFVGTGVKVVQSNAHAKLYRVVAFSRDGGGRPNRVEMEKITERSPGSQRNDCSLNAAATFFPTADRRLAMYCTEKEIRKGSITTREYRDEIR